MSWITDLVEAKVAFLKIKISVKMHAVISVMELEQRVIDTESYEKIVICAGSNSDLGIVHLKPKTFYGQKSNFARAECQFLPVPKAQCTVKREIDYILHFWWCAEQKA